jgi:hypothetical protein
MEYECGWKSSRVPIEGGPRLTLRTLSGHLYELNEDDLDEYDPTPWCTYCRAMKSVDCKCGPLADND